MSSIVLNPVNPALIPNPSAGRVTLFLGADGVLRSKDSAGNIAVYATGISPEEVQDIVGAMISGSGPVVVNYNDAGNVMTISLNASAISHTSLADIGTNTHAQIDSHIANTNNPHATTKAQVGLGNVPNVDATNPANITQSASYRFVTDTEKTTWNAKEPAIVNPNDISKYYRGDKTWATFPTIPTALSQLTNDANFETTTQLNSRDTANRNRVNHTGTQLAATISDFSSAAIGSLLTGLSLASSATISAADSILSALGKIQAQILGHFGAGGSAHALATTSVAGFMSSVDKTKLDGITNDVAYTTTSLISNSSNSVAAQISELTIPVVAGEKYRIHLVMLYRSAATGTGLQFSFGGAGLGGSLRGIARTIVGADGTAGAMQGAISAINDYVNFTGVQAANTVYVMEFIGTFICTSSGNLIPQFRSETNGTAVTVVEDSFMEVKRF